MFLSVKTDLYYCSQQRMILVNLRKKEVIGRILGSLWNPKECWRSRQEPKAARLQARWSRSQQRNSLVRVTQLCCWTQDTATGTVITGYWILLRHCPDSILLLAPLPLNIYLMSLLLEWILTPSLCHLFQIQSFNKGVWLSELRSFIHIQLPGFTRVSLHFSWLS